MKRGILFFVVLICSEFFLNAQDLQRGFYNDGRILVYIEQKNSSSKRAAWLQLENISGQEITVHYCYKAVGLDRYGNIFIEKMEYKTKTFKPGGKEFETGYINAIGGHYVDSFAIMNVSVKPSSTSQGNTGAPPPPQGTTVPSWAQGTWYNSNWSDGATNPASWITITSSQITGGGGGPTTVFRVESDVITFSNNGGQSFFRISRTNSPNQINMHNRNANPILFIKVR